MRVVHSPLAALALLILVISSCSSTAQPLEVDIVPAFPSLSFQQPTDIQNAGDGSNRLFVCEKTGRIRVFANSSSVAESEVFLDISSRVITPSEMGLLGLAFHPDYETNGYFYLNYNTDKNGDHITRISRFSVSAADPDRADPNSELILYEFVQPFDNHNGGQVAFGPDGYLYIATGDGGSGNDPQNNGQDLRTPLGKILRIDVDNPAAPLNYSIPDSNPFAGNSEYTQEIYAWGLRNPWRISFDTETGRLWAGDVGQNLFEEIDIIEKGGNYGWRVMEGFHCFNRNNPNVPGTSCDSTSLISPVWEYSHADGGNTSITGGYVYHGGSIPLLQGAYVYADLGSGRVWALREDGGPYFTTLLEDTELTITTFGVDEAQEMYFGAFNGRLYKLALPSGVEDGGEDDAMGAMLHAPRPNPSGSLVTIDYSIMNRGTTALSIFNVLGEKIADIAAGPTEAGTHTATFDTTGMIAGVYYIRLDANGEQISRKLTVAR